MEYNNKKSKKKHHQGYHSSPKKHCSSTPNTGNSLGTANYAFPINKEYSDNHHKNNTVAQRPALTQIENINDKNQSSSKTLASQKSLDSSNDTQNKNTTQQPTTVKPKRKNTMSYTLEEFGRFEATYLQQNLMRDYNYQNYNFSNSNISSNYGNIGTLGQSQSTIEAKPKPSLAINLPNGDINNPNLSSAGSNKTMVDIDLGGNSGSRKTPHSEEVARPESYQNHQVSKNQQMPHLTQETQSKNNSAAYKIESHGDVRDPRLLKNVNDSTNQQQPQVYENLESLSQYLDQTPIHHSSQKETSKKKKTSKSQSSAKEVQRNHVSKPFSNPQILSQLEAKPLPSQQVVGDPQMYRADSEALLHSQNYPNLSQPRQLYQPQQVFPQSLLSQVPQVPASTPHSLTEPNSSNAVHLNSEIPSLSVSSGLQSVPNRQTNPLPKFPIHTFAHFSPGDRLLVEEISKYSLIESLQNSIEVKPSTKARDSRASGARNSRNDKSKASQSNKNEKIPVVKKPFVHIVGDTDSEEETPAPPPPPPPPPPVEPTKARNEPNPIDSTPCCSKSMNIYPLNAPPLQHLDSSGISAKMENPNLSVKHQAKTETLETILKNLKKQEPDAIIYEHQIVTSPNQQAPPILSNLPGAASMPPVSYPVVNETSLNNSNVPFSAIENPMESDATTTGSEAEIPLFVTPFMYEKSVGTSLQKSHRKSRKSDSNEQVVATNALRDQSFFDGAVGKLLMDIGQSLVQETVQNDLLKLEKKKSRRCIDSTNIINLLRNLNDSQKKNKSFKMAYKICEFCDFKTESAIVMANHYETPHMVGAMYKCNFCCFSKRSAEGMRIHFKEAHNVNANIKTIHSKKKCPNCPYEDNGKSRLVRHLLHCEKRFKLEENQAPAADWEPPAKIPIILPKPEYVNIIAANNQALYQQGAELAVKAHLENQQKVLQQRQSGENLQPGGNPRNPSPTEAPTNASNQPSSFDMNSRLSHLLAETNSEVTIQLSSNVNRNRPLPLVKPSVSIIAVPQEPNPLNNLTTPTENYSSAARLTRINCEICDQSLDSFEKLAEHFQSSHNLNINLKMLQEKPFHKCEKCSAAAYTDEGFQRHLLCYHSLVTIGLKELANKGKDAGRCIQCGIEFFKGLVDHVINVHNASIKQVGISYSCTLCTAKFNLYRQFITHMHNNHQKTYSMSSKSLPNDSIGTLSDRLLESLQMNKQITVICKKNTN